MSAELKARLLALADAIDDELAQNDGEKIGAAEAMSYSQKLRAAADALPGDEPMWGAMIEADFEKNTVTFEMRGEYFAAAGLSAYEPTLTARIDRSRGARIEWLSE